MCAVATGESAAAGSRLRGARSAAHVQQPRGNSRSRHHPPPRSLAAAYCLVGRELASSRGTASVCRTSLESAASLRAAPRGALRDGCPGRDFAYELPPGSRRCTGANAACRLARAAQRRCRCRRRHTSLPRGVAMDAFARAAAAAEVTASGRLRLLAGEVELRCTSAAVCVRRLSDREAAEKREARTATNSQSPCCWCGKPDVLAQTDREV